MDEHTFRRQAAASDVNTAFHNEHIIGGDRKILEGDAFTIAASRLREITALHERGELSKEEYLKELQDATGRDYTDLYEAAYNNAYDIQANLTSLTSYLQSIGINLSSN